MNECKEQLSAQRDRPTLKQQLNTLEKLSRLASKRLIELTGLRSKAIKYLDPDPKESDEISTGQALRSLQGLDDRKFSSEFFRCRRAVFWDNERELGKLRDKFDEYSRVEINLPLVVSLSVNGDKTNIDYIINTKEVLKDKNIRELRKSVVAIKKLFMNVCTKNCPEKYWEDMWDVFINAKRAPDNKWIF